MSRSSDGTHSKHRAVEMARECQHPDAMWLTALLPPFVTRESFLCRVMRKQGDDPRALFLAWSLAWDRAPAELMQVAAMGHAQLVEMSEGYVV
jgi:hypothetical protein